MATLAQVEQALRNAHAAGDTNAARRLAAVVNRERQARAANPLRYQTLGGVDDFIVPGTEPVREEPGLMDKVVGTGEAALSAVTGATTGTVGMIANTLAGMAEEMLAGRFGSPDAAQRIQERAMRGMQALTYAPRTETGQEILETVGEVTAPLAGLTPIAGEIAMAGRAATTGARTVAQGAAPAVRSAITERVVAPIAGQVRSVTSPRSATTTSAGSAATPAALQRQTTAAQMDPPITLTRGAATRDAADLAFEKEQMRGPEGAPLRARAEENNLQALENFDNLIDSSGAVSVFSGPAAVGNSVVRALSAGWEAAKTRTRAAYTAARNSPEANEPVDLSMPVTIGRGDMEITDSVLGYLNKQPTGIPATAVPDAARRYAVQLGIAQVDESGALVPLRPTVSQVEQWRQSIGDSIGFDPRDIRQGTILKNLIDEAARPAGGAPFATARRIRQQQSRKYENRAVVARLITDRRGTDDPQVAADRVFHRTVVNGSPEELTFLRRVMQTSGREGREAWKELQAATVQYIKDEATRGMNTDSSGNPIISPARLHQVVTELDRNGRLEIMLGTRRARLIRDLNDLVRAVNTVPPGTQINNSGTAMALMSALAEAGVTGTLTGLPVPVLSILRLAAKHAKEAKLRARIAEHLGEVK